MADETIFTAMGESLWAALAATVQYQVGESSVNRLAIINRDVVSLPDGSLQAKDRRTEIGLLQSQGQAARNARIVLGDEQWVLVERILSDAIESRWEARSV